jgi:hypothetical protein
VVIVLAIGPKVLGSDPAKDDGIFKGNKIRSTIFFGGGGSKAVGPVLYDFTIC